MNVSDDKTLQIHIEYAQKIGQKKTKPDTHRLVVVTNTIDTCISSLEILMAATDRNGTTPLRRVENALFGVIPAEGYRTKIVDFKKAEPGCILIPLRAYAHYRDGSKRTFWYPAQHPTTKAPLALSEDLQQTIDSHDLPPTAVPSTVLPHGARLISLQ